MVNPESLFKFGAPLTSGFRSLTPSILNKNQRPFGAPQVPKQPELKDLTDDIFQNKELAALAEYFQMGKY